MDLSPGLVLLTSLSSYLLGAYYLRKASRLSRYMAFAFLAVVIYGIAVELTDVRTHHSYYYAELLMMFGGRPDWVPLAIGVAWASLILVAMRTSDLLGLPWAQRPLFDGALLAWVDLVIDPVASASRRVVAAGDSCVGVGEPFGGLGVWTWCVPEGNPALWFNIPLVNFFAWFLIAGLISLAIRLGARYLGAERRAWWLQVPMLGALALAAWALCSVGLDLYEALFTGTLSQRVVLMLVLATPIALVLIHFKRLNFHNRFDLGMLVAPLWMLLAGLGFFVATGVDRSHWPGAVLLLAGVATVAALLFLSPNIGTLLHGPRESKAPPSQPPGKKKKVAILGGGVGGIVTAFELTQPEVRDRYEVTVYQMGWRLGGKGASGRNVERNDRIEEHGIHLWAGLYDNAFRAMRAAYSELDRPAGAPLATWREAFKPMSDSMSFMELFKGDWLPWTLEPITNDQVPGDKDAHLLLPFWSYVGQGIQLVRRWFRKAHAARHEHHRRQSGFLGRMLSWLMQALVIAVIEVVGAVLFVAYSVALFVHTLLDRLELRRVLAAVHWVLHLVGGIVVAGIRLVTWVKWRRVRPYLDDDKTRRGWIFTNLGVGILSGLHKDDVVRKGFGTIDHLDFREWLAQHIIHDPVPGPSPYDCDDATEHSLTLSSPLALSVYNADFAFENGDVCKPRLSAGVAVYALVRVALSCRGSVMWEMQAGMGDAVFGPFYEVLKKRGVKFEFFSKVKALHLDDEGRRIASITVARQAELEEGRESYDPLIPVHGLDCWPSAPLWGQLKDGASYRDREINFEEWCSPELYDYPLEAGRDFDLVVLGISLGGFPYVCGELIEASPEWAAMVENIATVRTQATQLWFKKPADELGWKEGSQSVSCYDTTNFDVWYDFSHLIDRESWPTEKGRRPECLSYLNGTMLQEGARRGEKETCEELDQKAQNDRIKALAADFLRNQSFRIFSTEATEGTFDWDALIDDRDVPVQGEDRLDAQYFRANVQPTERYVQSLPRTTQCRLHPGDSKFDNLYLAGDWTWNSFNAGCVESATISGMLAANRMCGSPPLKRIVGLTFGYPHSRYGQGS